jgi:hypothetical protein
MWSGLISMPNLSLMKLWISPLFALLPSSARARRTASSLLIFGSAVFVLSHVTSPVGVAGRLLLRRGGFLLGGRPFLAGGPAEEGALGRLGVCERHLHPEVVLDEGLDGGGPGVVAQFGQGLAYRVQLGHLRLGGVPCFPPGRRPGLLVGHVSLPASVTLPHR